MIRPPSSGIRLAVAWVSLGMASPLGGCDDAGPRDADQRFAIRVEALSLDAVDNVAYTLRVFGGGGGAGEPGDDASGSQSGAGGDGLPSDISGALVYYAGGGGGGSSAQGAQAGHGGLGGGGAGGGVPSQGEPNSGGGGGGGGLTGFNRGGHGGSGIVIISYEILPAP